MLQCLVLRHGARSCRKYNRESDGKDPKYSASSTGGGIYRKYKIDQFIEPSGIVNTTDGTYPIRPEAAVT